MDTALTVAYSSPMVVIEMLFDANPLAEPSKYAWARYDPITQDLWTLGELLFSLLFGRPACFSLEGVTSQHKCLAKQLNKQLEWVSGAGQSTDDHHCTACKLASLQKATLVIEPCCMGTRAWSWLA